MTAMDLARKREGEGLRHNREGRRLGADDGIGSGPHTDRTQQYVKGTLRLIIKYNHITKQTQFTVVI